MEYEHDEDLSFPDHGFYSVQDESHRRYSRTGKHRILAQKYDASLMKYRYSDETEKSSPYSKTLSESDSPVPSDSAGSYQGVYSPQLAQRNGNFKDTPWTSSKEPRRSLIDEESASTWISPGVHPAITGPFEKIRHPFPDSLTTDNKFDFENVDPGDHWLTDDSSHRDNIGSMDESEQRTFERTNNEPSDDPSHREPPPPYSVAVRSSKGPAPRSYLDIVPELTKDLQGLPDIDRLLENLEGSKSHPELPYHNSDFAKPADKLQVDIINQPNVSVWAELVHIDESEDEKPLRPNNGIIITENRERRASSPDRHIRFVLEGKRGQSDPEDITRASESIDWMGPEIRELQARDPYDAEVGRDQAYEQHHGEPVGLTPLVDEVFSYPRTSDDAAPEDESSQNYGLDNPGYAYNIEELNNYTSVDQHRPTKKPVSSDSVRRRAIDWYGKGHVYDSSQSSTLDSVFTERSWASDVGQPRAYRQKRRVYPKPKDPVGDLGDGLQSKLGRKTIDKENDRLHQSSSARSRKPGDKDEMGQSRGHGAPSGGEHPRQEAQEGDVRRSLIKQELDLFMQRKSGPNSHSTSKRVGPLESRRPSAERSYNSRIASKATSASPHRPQQRAYIAGEHPLNSKGRTQLNSTRVNSRPKPRTFSDEHLHRAVPLRNPALVGKNDRPLTYPNDINRPFLQLIFQEDNNAIRNNLNKINENNPPSQRLRPTQEPRQHLSSKHPHRPGRDDNLRPHEQRPHRPHTTRRPSDNKGNRSQLPPKPQRHIRHDDSQPAGHVHPPGKPSLQTHPTHDRHHQYKPSNERRTRENNEITSNMSAVSQVPHRHVRPEPSANTNEKVNHRPANERRSRGEIEETSPTIVTVSEVPQLRRDPETPPSNNQQGQQGEQTPASRKKSDTGTFSNHRFFSVMAAIWFFPIGIWALRKSHQVDSHVKAKDLPGARKASKSARNHAIAAFVLFGFIVLILIARLIEITIDPRKTFIQYYEIVPEEVDRI
ncbi:uncharacterized protein LOC100892457 [Strongylocentrotus purpuratus]|uniref:Uncharacterized protein n=1 Tax=Strongylocentrotus purpuratus TaxID=7668 RepID=A0A7M7LL65_STRPU|nr:uncharacterized protein LOC100892457 [Strongylocentrotus purpuratus]|eukprot:XP_003724939.1 PREDICTED: uncharacterized protein LOC100892457 [Strongylocentrotus purpuratus]